MKTSINILSILILFLFLVACDDTAEEQEGCGDGIVTTGEQCDTDDLQGSTCQSEGFSGGTLACAEDCTLDTSGCTTPCGNGVIDGQEACDTEELQGATCQSEGFSGGTLSCAQDCTLDLTGCTTLCGNGIQEMDEACDDGNDTNGDGCSASCEVETGWECNDQSPSVCTSTCGDGLAVGSEECDGDDVGQQECADLGYHAGTLGCNDDCTLDLTSCEATGRCGDGIIQTTYGETCEGEDLGEQSCETLGYYAGTLSCGDSCHFDTSACDGRCGDGIIQPEENEECDLDDVNQETCESMGYYGGILTCAADCQYYDTSDCEAAGRCGDDIIQSGEGEVCDSSNLNGETCESLGFELGGTLHCNSCVAFDTTGCATSPALVAIPGGTFQLNATETNLITVSAFSLGREEVTGALFAAIMGTDPSSFSGYGNSPVENVNWYHAIAFCNKLSLREGLTPVYAVTGVDFSTLTFAQIPTVDDADWSAVTADWNADGYRLPTEMEWMWAAMGADTEDPGEINTTGYAKAFAGSTGANAVGDYAWYNANGFSYAHPVGNKLPNELGLYDMSGNVYEWTWDWYGSIPSGSLTDYRGATSGIARTRRGGYYNSDTTTITTAFRHNGYPSQVHYIYGFRIARQ